MNSIFPCTNSETTNKEVLMFSAKSFFFLPRELEIAGIYNIAGINSLQEDIYNICAD